MDLIDGSSLIFRRKSFTALRVLRPVKNKAKAANPYGVAGLGGKVSPEVVSKRMDAARALGANPKSDPAFFASLPLDTQQALETGVKTPSYKRGIETATRIAMERMEKDLNFIASKNRTSPTFSTTE